MRKGDWYISLECAILDADLGKKCGIPASLNVYGITSCRKA